MDGGDADGADGEFPGISLLKDHETEISEGLSGICGILHEVEVLVELEQAVSDGERDATCEEMFVSEGFGDARGESEEDGPELIGGDEVLWQGGGVADGAAWGEFVGRVYFGGIESVGAEPEE